MAQEILTVKTALDWVVKTAQDAGDGTGLEQYAYVESGIIDFASRFMKRTAEDRRSFLTLMEELAGNSDDEIKHIAIEFIRDLCEVADKREGVRRGA
ncbi:MAG: hypothetical protein A4E53_00392 [Pelotomaculum sp. PtaB.Bin104]|nr:MAG: hypothetical protein A4E53_00392 [Pelotomaculum sp. PtaB.Bin104]